jgi:acetylornithine/succinyldiaminopimelate/putrescine aminotransferase
VKTGFGRTGKMFAFEHWNLKPDMITIAKTMSGGYVPAAAVVTRRDIYQKVFSRLDRCVVHSTTFGRNNLAMACGLATIQVIEDEKLVENCAKRGEQLVSRLKEIQAKHEFIKEIRGKGLMLAIEFQEPKSFGLKMAWKGLHAVDKGLFPQMVVSPLMSKYQILTLVAGHNIDAISFLPPLIIGDNEIDYFCKSLDSVVSDLGKFPGPLWDFGMNLAKQAAAGKIKKVTT